MYLDVGQTLFRKAEQLVELWPHHTVYSFGVHYNAVGHEIIATEILQALGLVSLAD